MRGKIVNLCIGLMNLLFGALILVFTLYVPQDKTLLTVQENFVVVNIVRAIYALAVAVTIINIVQCYHHRNDTTFNTAYIIGIFSISFILIKEPVISAFGIISGIIILFKSIKENLVEIDSITGISISIVVMAVTAILMILSVTYSSIGESIKNKENKNETAYKEDYFKYITELDSQYDLPYINLKINGKYGYINTAGEKVIEFMYDYASPFIEINVYDKKFYIALVCKDGSSYIILKNGRKVLSYRTESADENYEAKVKELEDIYYNTLHQSGTINYEINYIDNNMNKVPAYDENTLEYTYRYDYNEEYDLIVTQSNLGMGDKYELAKKADLNFRITLDATALDYDSKYLYLFSNNTIPFYEISKRNQGWFTAYGMKNSMSGKAQILDFFEDKILLRNYNNDTIYFINQDKKIISEEYKDIFICASDRYIVRNNNDDGFFKVINSNYENIYDREFAAISPILISQNYYLVSNDISNLKINDYGYAITNWSLMNVDGEIIMEGIEQLYNQYYKVSTESSKNDKKYEELEEEIKALNYRFVGDQFYVDY